MAFICLQTIPDGVNSCSGYIYTGRETAISVLRSGRGRRRAGLGRCAVGDGLPEWCVGCADAAGGGDADDEAGADGFGVVVDLVDDVDTAFEASCGWDGGGGADADVFGDAFELLVFFVEGGDEEDDLGVTGLGVGGKGPGKAAAVDVDGEGIGVGGRLGESEGNAVVDHLAGVGGDEVGDEAARGILRIDTAGAVLEVVAFAGGDGKAGAIDGDADLAELLRVCGGVGGPVGEGVEARAVADGGADLGVDVVVAVEGAAAGGLGQLAELVVSAEGVVEGGGGAVDAGVDENTCRVDGVEGDASVAEDVDAVWTAVLTRFSLSTGALAKL